MNFGDYLNSITQTVGQTYAAVKGAKKPPAAPTSPIAPKTNYLPYIIGGGVLLVLAVVLVARRK